MIRLIFTRDARFPLGADDGRAAFPQDPACRPPQEPGLSSDLKT